MTIIQVGTDATLKATTLEHRIFEAFYMMSEKQISEDLATTNIEVDLQEKTVRIEYSIPAQHSVSTDGSTILIGADILNDNTFVPGDIDPTNQSPMFVSDNLNGQIVEMLMFGQNLEISQQTGNSGLVGITATYDSDSQRLNGTVLLNLSVTRTDNEGSLEIKAIEYLT